MTPPPTVFLGVRGGFAPRFLLRTEIVPTLRRRGVRVVVLSPNADEPYFRDEFAANGVAVERLEAEAIGRYGRTPGVDTLRVLRLQVASNRGDLTTLDQMQAVNEDSARSAGATGHAVSLALKPLTALARRSRLVRAAIVGSETKAFSPLFHESLYRKYQPRALVVTSLGFCGSEPDNYLMREAHRFGARVIAAILSWDNTSAKGLRGGPVDHVIAWTDVMKRELEDYHDIAADRVSVAGPPHFDYYYRPPVLSRDEFFAALRLDPSRPLLTFGTKSPTNYPWNEEVAEMIARAIDDGRIERRCQLLLRLHPIYYRQRNGVYKFGQFIERARELAKRYACVHLDEPTILSSVLPLDMPGGEMDKLVGILRYSAVLVNIYSTLNLEAAITDTPCVNVSFNGTGFPTTVRRNIVLDEMQPHNQRVVRTGGVAVVRDEQELVAAINGYLRDPSLHREGRRLIRDQECGRFPGRAGAAMGEMIADVVGA